MKSNDVHTQCNLKGKKSKRLSCGCCTMQDFREDYKEKQDLKEMIADIGKRYEKTLKYLTEH